MYVSSLMTEKVAPVSTFMAMLVWLTFVVTRRGLEQVSWQRHDTGDTQILVCPQWLAGVYFFVASEVAFASHHVLLCSALKQCVLSSHSSCSLRL